MSDEKYLLTKKDLDMIKMKINWAFQHLFENMDKMHQSQTIEKFKQIDESQDDLDILQDYLDILQINYSFLLEGKQRVKADFFDWSINERR